MKKLLLLCTFCATLSAQAAHDQPNKGQRSRSSSNSKKVPAGIDQWKNSFENDIDDFLKGLTLKTLWGLSFDDLNNRFKVSQNNSRDLTINEQTGKAFTGNDLDQIKKHVMALHDKVLSQKKSAQQNQTTTAKKH